MRGPNKNVTSKKSFRLRLVMKLILLCTYNVKSFSFSQILACFSVSVCAMKKMTRNYNYFLLPNALSSLLQMMKLPRKKASSKIQRKLSSITSKKVDWMYDGDYCTEKAFECMVYQPKVASHISQYSELFQIILQRARKQE